MIETSFQNKKFDSFYDDCEHDDYMDADDYDRRRYERDGWNESRYDRQYW
jgi:hypothetical protein